MSTPTAVGYPSTLAGRVVGRTTVLTDVLLVVGGAAFVGLAAQIAVPLWPVPITGQTLAVLLAGAALGTVRGTLSMVLYAVAGVLGVPWFSAGTAGWHVILGPTGGYIVGFIAAAALAGWAAQRRWDRRFLRALVTFVGGSVLPFAFGLPWLAVALGLNLEQTLVAGLYPFIIGGIVKALIAAAVLPLCWRMVARRDNRS
jgi:biotin transport system substrate-specific component